MLTYFFHLSICCSLFCDSPSHVHRHKLHALWLTEMTELWEILPYKFFSFLLEASKGGRYKHSARPRVFECLRESGHDCSRVCSLDVEQKNIRTCLIVVKEQNTKELYNFPCPWMQLAVHLIPRNLFDKFSSKIRRLLRMKAQLLKAHRSHLEVSSRVQLPRVSSNVENRIRSSSW